MLKIGFIGLGIMGKPMAKNLVDAGYSLTVFNRSRGSIDELVHYGALAGKDARDVAERSDVIITMLPDSPDVEAVFTGENGLVSGLDRGKVVIDMSSIDPSTSSKMNDLVNEKDAEMLDAPVSGGEQGAIEAVLAIMVGGKLAVFKEARPILEKLGKTITHVGSTVGAGNTVKLINQMMVAIHMGAMSEALSFGEKSGVKPEVAYEAIKQGLAGSKVLDMKVPNIVNNNFEPGFRVNLHHKDLNNAINNSKNVNAKIPLSETVMTMFEELLAQGDGQSDHSALYKLYN